MSALMEILGQVLASGATDSIASQAGVPPPQAQSAVGMALPILIGALNRNAATPEGRQALDAAVSRDHDGSLLDQLGSFLGGAGASEGAGAAILGHVLGARQPQVQQQIAQRSGLDTASVGKILALLAPIVMAALGRARGQAGGADLGSILGGAQAQVKQTPGSGSLLGLLDRDGDGSVADDVAQMGIGLLGSLMGGKR